MLTPGESRGLVVHGVEIKMSTLGKLQVGLMVVIICIMISNIILDVSTFFLAITVIGLSITNICNQMTIKNLELSLKD